MATASQLVARCGQRIEAEHLGRERRRGLFDVVALVVDEGLDPSPGGTGDDVVPHAERPVLHDHGGHRALAGVEVGLEHDAPGTAFGVGPELLDFGHHHQLLQQVVDAQVLQGGHLDHDRVASPSLRDQAQVGELLHDMVGVGVGAVDLVDGHDDRHVGGLGVVERFDGLGHHAVVSRHDEHDDVGHFRAAGAHSREGLVTRRVYERDDGPVAVATW